VFGRAGNFDSQNDSIVRVHVGRLRWKLAEYYNSEGADDHLVISVPKGSYHLSLHYRTGPRPSRQWNSRHLPHQDLLSVFAVALARGRSFPCACACLGGRQYRPHVAGRTRVPPGLATFWHSFLANDDRVLIVYSNVRVRSLDSDQVLLFPPTAKCWGFPDHEVFHLRPKAGLSKHGRMLSWTRSRMWISSSSAVR